MCGIPSVVEFTKTMSPATESAMQMWPFLSVAIPEIDWRVTVVFKDPEKAAKKNQKFQLFQAQVSVYCAGLVFIGGLNFTMHSIRHLLRYSAGLNFAVQLLRRLYILARGLTWSAKSQFTTARLYRNCKFYSAGIHTRIIRHFCGTLSNSHNVFRRQSKSVVSERLQTGVAG